jgi:hypothetical protein
MEPSGVVDPGSYNALPVSAMKEKKGKTYSDPRLEVRQMIVFLKLT